MSYPNPTFSRETAMQGNGAFIAKIHFNSILLHDCDPFLMRTLYYEFIETVNGIEAFVEDPQIKNASSLDEDIRESLKLELRSQGIIFDQLFIHFIEPRNH